MSPTLEAVVASIVPKDPSKNSNKTIEVSSASRLLTALFCLETSFFIGPQIHCNASI